MREEYSAGAVVFFVTKEKEIKYLLLKHEKAQYWDFPKGKIEKGEKPKQTAVREIFEEAGVEVDLIDGFAELIKYSFTGKEKEFIEKEVTFFLARAKDNKITLSHEHVDYKWLSFKQAYQKVTYANSRKVLQRASQVLSHVDL